MALEATQRLANYRAHNTRASQEIVRLGAPLLEKLSNGTRGQDDSWQSVEQLALAALDVGKPEIAGQCLQLLRTRFPDSSRVQILAGILIEATRPPERALEYYRGLVTDEAPNPAAWKRIVCVLITAKQTEAAIKELSTYLDTFYSDVEAWLELADLYLSHNQYSSALQCLSHVLLISPQNPFYTLQFAEIAYTANDVPLALKMFLVVTEMCDSSSSLAPPIPEGVSARAWWGIKLASKRLLSDPRTSSNTSLSSATSPKQLKTLEELATERILSLYTSNTPGRETVLKWMEQ